MPDQEQLDDCLEALESAGSPARNTVLREQLGWEEAVYEEVKAELVRKGIVVRGRCCSTDRASKRSAPSIH